ncbi:hypothetical protein [Stappia sp.]|uniref:hypothetical protein n=1 Tax=Stappia sp. TaxID=1870903 RepID=UPI0032D95F91
MGIRHSIIRPTIGTTRRDVTMVALFALLAGLSIPSGGSHAADAPAASGSTATVTDTGTTATVASSALPKPNVPCTCRFRGEDYQIGEIACLKGPQGPRLARCDMTLNNTSWIFLDVGCPTM